jgi:hypothetical protein
MLKLLSGMFERKRRLGKIGVDLKIILKRVFGETVWDGVGWTYMAHDRNPWRAVRKTARNRRVP